MYFSFSKVQRLLQVVRRGAHTTFHVNPYVVSEVRKDGKQFGRTRVHDDTFRQFLFMTYGMLAKNENYILKFVRN
jgi:hypothetical protein